MDGQVLAEIALGIIGGIACGSIIGSSLRDEQYGRVVAAIVALLVILALQLNGN